MATKAHADEQAKITAAWAAGKATRDAAIAAAYELPLEERGDAIGAAKAAWQETKNALREQQAALDAATAEG